MKQRSLRVLIIGYGEMGHAMEHLLLGKHQLSIHDSSPSLGLAPINLEEQASLADAVLLCVPASPHREILERLAPHLQSHCICLSISKGLDDMGNTPAQNYQQVFAGEQPYCLLYGPMISEEIRANRYAFAEVGCESQIIYETVRALYQDSKLLMKHSTDLTGISWSVILKNVYAIAFGISDELQFGDNTRGFLTVAALAEITSIVRQMGGDPSTPLRLAGLGDLITTATSSSSHHHELGRKLAHGTLHGISGEGIHTLQMIDNYQLFDIKSYPLYSFIHATVRAPVNTAKNFSNFLNNHTK